MGAWTIQDVVCQSHIRIRDAKLKLGDIVKTYKVCQLTKSVASKKEPWYLIQRHKPEVYWETNYMEIKQVNFRLIIIIIDTFSGWTEAFPTKHVSIHRIAKTNIDKILLMHGFPKLIGSDNGPTFVSR